MVVKLPATVERYAIHMLSIHQYGVLTNEQSNNYITATATNMHATKATSFDLPAVRWKASS
jgi:hypothetical protein